jgi:hypothetical protein
MGDHMHLNREKAWNQYKDLMKDAQQEEELISIEIVKLMVNSSRWEDRFGSIAASQTLIEREGSSDLKDFQQFLVTDLFTKIFVDEECRVRNQCGLLFKTLILSDQAGIGMQCFDKLKCMLLDNIEATFTRGDSQKEASGAIQIKPDPNSGKTRQDAEGWKSLETSMRILLHIIEGIGTRLYSFDL